MYKWKLRRYIALLCLVALLVGLAPTVMAYGDASSWFIDELDKMEELGLIPEELAVKESLKDGCTRLEMCAVAVLAYETYLDQEIEVTEAQPFTDTDSPIVAKACAVGLVKGYHDGTFRPEGLLTRQEFFAFVYQFLLAVGYEPQQTDYADITAFEDADKVSAWALEETQLVVGIGVVEGDGKRLTPQATATCEQALAMFCRAYLFLPQQEPTPPPTDPEGPTEPQDPMEPTEPAEPLPFEEKYPNMASWAKEELLPMDEAGLIPELLIGREMDTSITRKEMCYIAVTAFTSLYEEFQSEPLESPFADVDDPIITQAYYLGIVNGFPDGTFQPDSLITRQQIFTMTGNFLSAAGYYRTDSPETSLDAFEDAREVQNYALPSTRLLVDIGIVKGDGKLLSPKSNAQCQQALALFYRSYNYLVEWTESQGGDDQPTDRPEAEALVEFALQFEGYNYVWGGEDPETGFDCSGLVYYVFHHFDYPVGRTATQQWYYEAATEVALEDLLPGDLVFFSPNFSEDNITHVGIYIGEGRYIHAANSARGVVIDEVDGYYFTENFLGAKRVIT